MNELLIDGPDDAPTLLLSHGSGAPMDTPFMNEFTAFAVSGGIRVVRFEFAFMAGRRTTGKKPPPPRADKLIPEFMDVIEQISAPAIFIGGKSLGARVATMMAQQCFDEGKIAGTVCLGYPYHPPKKPDSMRTAHFANYNCPTLICQGERDPFGTRQEIELYDLPDSFEYHWAPFGNHDMTPLKRSGLTSQDNWANAAAAVAAFMKTQAL